MTAASSSWGPTLSAERVRLEPIDSRRAQAMLLGAPEPDLPWADGFPLPTLHEALTMAVAADEPLGPFFAYVIVRRSDGLAVGDAGFHGPPGADREVEIGFALAPAARGQGLAYDAARLLIEWALTQPGVDRVTARVDANNGPSVRLLKRLGFAPEGERDGLRRMVLPACAV